MNEDVTTVSPTLGFIIKTIDFQGYDYLNSIIYQSYSLTFYTDIDSTYVRMSTTDTAQPPLTTGHQGTLEAKRLSDLIGKTTLRRQIH